MQVLCVSMWIWSICSLGYSDLVHFYKASLPTLSLKQKKRINSVSSLTFCMTTDWFPWGKKKKKGSKVLELSQDVNWKDLLPCLYKVWIWGEWVRTLALELGWLLLVVPEHTVCVAQIDLFLRSNIVECQTLHWGFCFPHSPVTKCINSYWKEEERGWRVNQLKLCK